ncbi:hypothetical protein EON64_15690, partial [archaeon]
MRSLLGFSIIFVLLAAVLDANPYQHHATRITAATTEEYQDPIDMNATWDCNRPWPSNAMFLTLYVPDAKTRQQGHDRHTWSYDKHTEWESIFLHGAMMYWPWKKAQTKLLVMVDAEMKNTTELQHDVLDVLDKYQRQLGDQFPPAQVLYNDYIAGAYHSGYGRMQYLGFLADQFVREEHVVFVDSDTLFHTYVDREDLFDHGKPIINGRISGRNDKEHEAKTLAALGGKERFSCMSYFPVVLRTADLPFIREAIRQHLQKDTFEEAYFNFTVDYPGAQYNIMCAWLYAHRHDAYVWRLKNDGPGLSGVDRSLFHADDLNHLSVPYLSEHVTYVDLSEHQIFPRRGQALEAVRHISAVSMCFLETRNVTLQPLPEPSHLT